MIDKRHFVFVGRDGWEQLSYGMTKAAAVSYIRSRRLHNQDEESYCIMEKLTEEDVSLTQIKDDNTHRKLEQFKDY